MSVKLIVLALCLAVAEASGPRPAHADGSTAYELRHAPLTPRPAPVTQERAHLLDELYSHYVECLENVGREETCYRRWRRQCEAVLPGECDVLEDQMFPPAPAGDETC